MSKEKFIGIALGSLIIIIGLASFCEAVLVLYPKGKYGGLAIDLFFGAFWIVTGRKIMKSAFEKN
jgi:hypothetical protein